MRRQFFAPGAKQEEPRSLDKSNSLPLVSDPTARAQKGSLLKLEIGFCRTIIMAGARRVRQVSDLIFDRWYPKN